MVRKANQNSKVQPKAIGMYEQAMDDLDRAVRPDLEYWEKFMNHINPPRRESLVGRNASALVEGRSVGL